MSRVSVCKAIRLADTYELSPRPTFSDFHVCHNLPLAHSYDPFVVTPPTAIPRFVSMNTLEEDSNVYTLCQPQDDPSRQRWIEIEGVQERIWPKGRDTMLQ